MVIDVKLHLVEVSAIRDREEEFVVETYVYQTWKDPSLAFDTGEKEKAVPVEGHWTPNLEFVKARDVKKESDEELLVSPDGTAVYVQHMWVTLSTDLDLTNFPFDEHVLRINLESFTHGSDELRFAISDASISAAEFSVVEGWRLVGIKGSVQEHHYPAENETYSRFVAEVRVRRESPYYLWKIVLPLVLIMVMSWSVFWLDPGEIEAQMGVAVTSMLSVVAFNFAIADTLPRISYVTRMDVFIVLGYVFVFATFLENLVTHWYVRKDDHERANRVDFWCRILFPAAFCVEMAAFLLWP
jgi:hypothetical protein